jgi:hypothetical protein
MSTEGTMSTATVTGGPTAEGTRAAGWITLAGAVWITRRHYTTVRGRARPGSIGIRGVPGARTRDSRTDFERLAAVD